MFTFLPPSNIFFILADVLEVLLILIIVEVIRSYANMFGVRNTSSYTPWVRTLQKIIQPVLEPFRQLWQALVRAATRNSRSTYGMLSRVDLSPMLAIIAIEILQGILFKMGVSSLLAR